MGYGSTRGYCNERSRAEGSDARAAMARAEDRLRCAPAIAAPLLSRFFTDVGGAGARRDADHFEVGIVGSRRYEELILQTPALVNDVSKTRGEMTCLTDILPFYLHLLR